MWKARATAHVSPQMTSHSTTDQPRLASSRSGRRRTPSPDANSRTRRASAPRAGSGRTASARATQARSHSGWPASTNIAISESQRDLAP